MRPGVPRATPRLVRRRPGEPQVDEHGAAFVVDHEVRRGHVAVQNAHRVERGQGLQRVVGDP